MPRTSRLLTVTCSVVLSLGACTADADRRTRSASPSTAVQAVGSPDRKPLTRCFGERATIVGTPGRDRLTGTRRTDVIIALGGDDDIKQVDARDRVCAGAGNDTVRYATNAQVSLGAGDDILESAQSGTVLAGGGDDSIELGSLGRVSGGRGDDVVTSLIVDGAWPNIMAGGPGADRLAVLGVRPAMYHDVMFEPCVSYDGADRGVRVDLARGVARGHGQDVLVGVRCVHDSDHRDIPVGSPDADGFWAEGGRDIIRTGRGNDSIVNGPGGDRISLGAGTDRVEALGRSGDDLIVGGPGPDFVYGGYGADRIIGGKGDDELRAFGACQYWKYSEPLTPDGAADHLFGGPGRDALTGSTGPDILTGGPGSDWVKVDPNHVGKDDVWTAETIGGCPSTES